MYKTKKDVDKHVENLLSKVPDKEFKNRAYSIANLYFNVGDYASCQKYVEQYLTQKDNNAAAYKLLGQALQKLGQKEKALEQFKISLDIDPTHTSTLLDICELILDDNVDVEPGHTKYWTEKAEATFPRHPITYKLREKLVSMTNSDPEALVNLLNAELAIRPKDATLHIRLIKHCLHTHQYQNAFEHACNMEFSLNAFLNNITWYEAVSDLLKQNLQVSNDWLRQLLLLTVKERLCLLSLSEIPSGTSKSLVETNEMLHEYDQALEVVAKEGASSGFGEFHSALLQHHRGQFALHAATFLLKKAKKDNLNWRDATKFAAPLMLMAWHTAPIDSKVNWLRLAPEKQSSAVNRWYSEAVYRCSQSGHYLLSNLQDKSQTFLDQISQCCSGTHWRDKLYEKVFIDTNHFTKIKTSHFVSNANNMPILRLPRKTEVEAYDTDAQKVYGNSLHHFVWMLSNYKNYAHFKCSTFDMLTSATTSCGPESLNKLDVQAFLYCATLTTQQKINMATYTVSDKPLVVPANITDLLCTLPQMKWWDCAYKFSQNELGTELTDIRSTLSRGIEVVRCVDSHGLDPVLLCLLGDIFCEKAKLTTNTDEKSNLEDRAFLYYSTAIPFLEKLKNRIVLKVPYKRMFDYTLKDNSKELMALIEKSKLFVAVKYYHEKDIDKVIQLLSNIKSPQAYYYLSQTYKNIALEEKNLSKDSTPEMQAKYVALLTKAKTLAFKALDKIKEVDSNKTDPMYSETQELIEDIESHLNILGQQTDEQVIDDNINYLYDLNSSYDNLPTRSKSSVYRDASSTPKPFLHSHSSKYRTAIDSQILESTRMDHQYLERIESEMKNLQNRDLTINNFMEQTKIWFAENQKLGNQIMSTIHSNIQNTTDQFKLLKISIDQVKDQINECKNDCKDVGDLKKQIAELKKEVNKLKKSSSEQTIDENDLYNLDDEYRTNDNVSGLASQLPFNPPQVIPSFNQRIVPPFPVPPHPYQFYNQSLYNLYNHYSQFTQPSAVPGAPPIFDPTRAQMNYPGMYPTPEQVYLDVAPLVTANVAPVSNVPTAPGVTPLSVVSTIPNAPVISVAPVVTSVTTSKGPEVKDVSRSLPVNVVITSSDPLPTCTSTPTPILSVTIPSKHIKNTPHNYQIPMPPTNETKVISPPIFSFPMSENKMNTTTNSLPNWNQSNVFRNTQINASQSSSFVETPSLNNMSKGEGFSFNSSQTVVDGRINETTINTSLNKSRTLSEKSNTSVENYDPCPDFKPIVPLPAEVKVTTGEEDESIIFSSRAKLFRFVDKQWKERGLGEMKLLKHNVTDKVRVLMRREQIHKVCANHIITSEVEIKPMKNETKAYFWVANDFADEVLVLEKFCIRFKTADIARDFYDAFEKARIESSKSEKISSERIDNTNSNNNILTPVKEQTSQIAMSESGKTTVGGFTFSSTPTFKSVPEDDKADAKPAETPVSKANVFSGLSFKSTNVSPFSNLFTSTLTTISPSDSGIHRQENQNKLNSSETVEEFESTAEFKPVIPLPALVDVRTGEEDEIVLFEHRAKLLRYDATTKEWKERGLGNIKLLVHKDNLQKLRLLMRREQTMKVCCNHSVTKDMIFQKMPKSEKDVTWCAKDFSEGELVPETFCLRFKTVQLCDSFLEAIKSAQVKMKDESKAAKEEKNAAKQITQSGFGDKFKAKAGSWCCQGCYTNNLENFTKCACCEQPKPQEPCEDSTTVSNFGEKFQLKPGGWECQTCLIRYEAHVQVCAACNTPKYNAIAKPENKEAQINTFKFTFGTSVLASNQNEMNPMITTVGSTNAISSGWGDKFKPKQGTWECKSCLIRNESNADNCSACNTPKSPTTDSNTTSLNKGTILNSNNTTKFNFGIPSQAIISTDNSKQDTTTTTVSIGWGDKFKPKEETWECKSCYVRNEIKSLNCCSCNNAKDGHGPTKSLFDNTSTGNKFSFGIPSNTCTDQNIKNETTSIFDGSGAHKFSFGVPNTFLKPNNEDASGESSSNQKLLFGTPKVTDSNQGPLQFGSKNSNVTIFDSTLKPALLPTPQKENTGFAIIGKESGSGTFDFVFKPKTPPKGKSPMKSPRSEAADESDDSVIPAEEDHVVHCFTPVIPLPDKVEVITGEEDEDELYGHRAKLYRFTSGEWKERGIGIVKILKHKVTGRLRVIMRREQVLKICLNHALKPEIAYIQKDDKTWLFAANDFSEGEFNLDQFCLRFKSKEIALEFKAAIDKALEGSLKISRISTERKLPIKDDSSDDVVFVSEIQATIEEKQKAKELKLPENFYTYKNRSPCEGCIGCVDEDDEKSDSSVNAASDIREVPVDLSTPVKSEKPLFLSPCSSFYGTPATLEKTFDTSVFRTPLGSAGFARNETPSFSKNADNKDVMNKENTLVDKSKLPVEKTEENDKNTVSLTSTAIKAAILTPPKLSVLNFTTEIQNTEPKTSSSAVPIKFSESKPIFGSAQLEASNNNNSVFGFSANKTDSQNEVKSIFHGNHKPDNLFSASFQGSIFGPGALSNNQTKPSTGLFGSQSAGFGGGKSIFSSTIGKESAWKLPPTSQNVSEDKSPIDVSHDKASELKKDKDQGLTPTLPVKDLVTFAELTSNGPGFTARPNFQWEGAGQQLFTGAQKGSDAGRNESEHEAGGPGGEEEYDPHYEPIVPLPDKIVVVTGEEDEEKLFGERCKLYRYDDKSREWKERGVGELKILYHPERKTYRLLLRREQVHKAVLNMLLFMDLELLPLKNSDRAWTWVGRNYAETSAGEQETLAVRFKSIDLATAFHKKVVECVQKLQAAAAQAVEEKKNTIEQTTGVLTPLRLPKHLDASARADNSFSVQVGGQAKAESASERAATTVSKKEEEDTKPCSAAELLKQVHFEEHEDEDHEDDDDDDEDEEDYDNDYEDYYNEEEDDSAACFSGEGEVLVRQGASQTSSAHAHVSVLFDQDLCSPKIIVTDSATGEILADMLIHTETEFQMNGEVCSWSGTDYTSNDPVEKSVTVTFFDSETAIQFYDSCETSKAATYSSTDPES